MGRRDHRRTSRARPYGRRARQGAVNAASCRYLGDVIDRRTKRLRHLPFGAIRDRSLNALLVGRAGALQATCTSLGAVGPTAGAAADSTRDRRQDRVAAARADSCGSPIAGQPAPPAEDRPKHKLVVLGDSIKQGFRSLAVHETSLSWPALVARYGGIEDFRHPVFPGPVECPGLPLNLDALIQRLSWPGSALDIVDDVDLLAELRRQLKSVEDYWERGPGADLVQAATGRVGRDVDRINHNLACWGYDLRDSFALTVSNLRSRVEHARDRGRQLLGGLPSAAFERSALITLAGGRADDTSVSLATALGADGGIETLVVALGANNILSSVVSFQLRWSDDPQVDGRFDEVDHKDSFTAWAPEHFRSEYDELLRHVADIKAQHVIVFTVPHVTIVPAAHGVGTKMTADRYFSRYTRPWIRDDQFSPNRHPCMTGDELRTIDFAIDLYNDHIVSEVARRNTDLEAAGGVARWHVLDIAGVLDRLAYRRYLIDEQAQPAWWAPYDLPAAFLELSPIPDTRYFRSDRFGRNEGGLIGLDGVHPTTLGYSLIDREVMNLMTHLGVPLRAVEPDYEDVIAKDLLNSSSLPTLDSILTAVSFVNRTVDLYEVFQHHSPI